MTKVFYSLYDRMLSIDGLRKGFKKVKSANGAAGIDGQSVKDFAQNLEENIVTLAAELKTKSYLPLPVKRVEIDKPGGKGKRKLGIPTVRDRVVQQTLLNILQPIFDPDFHPSSYAYRSGRSAHQAIAKASMFIRDYDLVWCVDMDLSKCFDTLDHEIILEAFRRRVTDGSILNLLRAFLESGVMLEDGWKETKIGSPQGGVISPLVSNVYLDIFDQFMMKRNHRIVRYADDILILTRSESAAKNALSQATLFLEKELKLTVNQNKTHITTGWTGVKFLGMIIQSRKTLIQPEKIRGLKEKVRKITRRNSPVNLGKVIRDLNPVIRGFANYFRFANCLSTFRILDGWIRRRLRAKQLRLWKKPRRLHRRLRQLKYQGEFRLIRMNSWRNSFCTLSHMAIPNNYLRTLGLYEMSGVKTGISVPFS